MTMYDEEDVMGFEDEEGYFCSACWEESGKELTDSVYILTEDELALEAASVVCQQCGKVIWGFDLAFPY